MKTEKADSKIPATCETFHSKIILMSTDLTSKVTECGKTKRCYADDNIVGEAETASYSTFGALFDKITDVSHARINREAIT